MTKALVHGIPETADVWSRFLPELAARGVDDVVVLSPPGFGAPAPDDFAGTHDAYARWLASELERLEPPVDLLGHDLGAGTTFAVAADRPDLIRSWVADIAGLLHADYEWHSTAQNLQQPEAGEAGMDFMLSIGVEGRAAAYADLGLPPEMAEAMAAGFDADMARCMLAFYRSAVDPALSELAVRLRAASPRPSLVIVAGDDAYVPAVLTRSVAEDLGAATLELPGDGHWWMASDPDRVADGVVAFWAALD